jgi:hypothetical protein
MNADDRDDYDDFGDDDDYDFNPEREKALKEAFENWDRKITQERNVTRAKQTEITLLELQMHALLEEQLKKNSFSAAAADLEAQELLQRISRR